MDREPANEAERLGWRYREMADEELLALYKEFAELTDEAQYALKAEIRNRKLATSVQPVIAPKPALPNEYELKPIAKKVLDGLEVSRLMAQYVTLSDQELLALKEEFDNLTDEAQQALMAEMRNRRLKLPEASMPAADPTTIAGYEFDLRVELEEDGLAYLITFWNGLDLGLACDYLDEAGIDLKVDAPKPRYQEAPRFHICVAPADIDQAKLVLRRTMGLFPLPEQHAAQVEGRGFIDDEKPLALGYFEDRGDAEQTTLILTNAGIPHKLIPPDTSGDDNEPMYSIEVSARHFNRALEVAAGGLGIKE